MTDADRLADLMVYVRQNGWVCPKPTRWDELYKLLPDTKRVGVGWEPPLPLILAAWWSTSPEQKANRLRAHLEYAADNGALSPIDAFLRGLPEEDWASPDDM